MIVVRRGEDCPAIGAACSHYGGPLAEGLLVEDTIRCPWHAAPAAWRRAPSCSRTASRWDVIEVDGSIEQRDCAVRYRASGHLLALASVSRDRESLEAELALEQAPAR